MLLSATLAAARSAAPSKASGPMPPPTVASAVKAASARTGVSFSYLMTQAAVESGYDTQARAKTSSATGLYQFIDATWLDMVRRHGAAHGLGAEAAALRDGGDAETRAAVLALREDPKHAAAMAAEYARENGEQLERTLGRQANPTELYLAHFLGAGGARSFLSAMAAQPDRAAAEVLPAAADANRGVFYAGGAPRSLEDVYRHFAAKFGGDDGPAASPGHAIAVASRQPESAAVPRATPAAPRTVHMPGAVAPGMAGALEALQAPGLSSWQAQLFASRLPLPGDSGRVV